jgi:predicted permease
MFQDLRFACRSLRTRPGFAFLAILTITLGIGLNVSMFTIADGILWKPLSYSDADQLVKFSEASGSGLLNCSYPNAEDWKKRSGVLEDIALERPFPAVVLKLNDDVASLNTGFTHSNLFSLLRVQPVLGRLFTTEDDHPGGEPAGVISDQAWERYFGRDPAVIGRHVRALVAIEGQKADSIVIVGVLPPGFRYDNRDLWLPLNRFWGTIDADRGNHWFSGVGRLRPGVSLERARTDLDAVSRDLERQYPSTNKAVRAVAEGLVNYYAGNTRIPLLLLLGAVGFVLLIACTNVVHLLLARTVGRRREIAVRLALGADRLRLLRLLLSEGLVIAATGGIGGALFSLGAVQWFVASQPRLLPRTRPIHVDSSTLLYASAITFATFLILGVIPTLSSRTRVLDAMQASGRGGDSRNRQRLGWVFIAAEIAMASILLMGTLLMVQTLRNLTLVDLGYQPENVIAVSFSLSPFKYGSDAEVSAASQRILDEVQSLSGVISAAFASPFTIGGNGMLPPVSLPGRANPPTLPLVPAITVSPGFFETLRIPLRAGRFFDSHHARKQEVIVNEEFARRFFPGEDPVGLRIQQNGIQEVIGVAGNTRLQGPVSQTLPEVYWLGDGAWGNGTLLIRTAGSPEPAIASIRDRLKHFESEIRLESIATLPSMEQNRTALPRFTRTLLLIFAALAIVMAAMGIYGVASYGVAQRRHEIGVRLALGASSANVAWLVLRQTFGATAAGGVAGVIGGSILAKLLTFQFYGVTPRDPWIYAVVLTLILVASLAASLMPVLSASNIDPAVSLRQE